jgi:hypothetical protein
MPNSCVKASKGKQAIAKIGSTRLRAGITVIRCIHLNADNVGQ